MSKYEFLNKKEDEEILLSTRQNPWVFLKSMVYILIAAIVFGLSFIFLKDSTLLNYIAILLIILCIYILFRAWFIWWNQVYIITSDRVITVEQDGWFSRSMSESTLENILYLNHEIKGPIKTLFGFGDVRIRASGVTEDEIVFFNVSNPYEIQQIIVKAQKNKNENRQISENKNPVKTIIR